jgi:hypothetical protein
MFDLVYLDGDHRYKQVSTDIRNAERLVGDGGILCGDDLELQAPAVDLENAKDNAHLDFILDPKTGQYYHPGITLAVAECFGDVSSWDGFWAVRKCGSKWEKVAIGEL